MTPEEKEKQAALRKKLFQEKIERLESLGFKVTKTGDDGVNFFVSGRVTGTNMHMQRGLLVDRQWKTLHLGNEEWNIIDHLIYVLRDRAREVHEQAVRAIAEEKVSRTSKRYNRHYDLPKLHTRVLMEYLRRARSCGGRYDPCYSGGGDEMRAISIEEIKAELSKRPHVHNKKEAQEIRRNKQKQRKDRGGVRR